MKKFIFMLLLSLCLTSCSNNVNADKEVYDKYWQEYSVISEQFGEMNSYINPEVGDLYNETNQIFSDLGYLIQKKGDTQEIEKLMIEYKNKVIELANALHFQLVFSDEITTQ